jgi:hypothetical protein
LSESFFFGPGAVPGSGPGPGAGPGCSSMAASPGSRKGWACSPQRRAECLISSSVPESWCSFASLPGSRRGPLFELPLASSQAGPAVIYTVAPSPPLSRLDLQPTSQIQPARLLLSPDVAPSLSAVAAARQRRCVAVAPSTSPASPASAPRSVAPAPSVAAVFWPRAHPPCGGLNAGNGGADA